MATMKQYVSTEDVYIGGAFYKAGEPFVSDTSEPGNAWKAVTGKEAAAIEAATNPVPDDAQLDAASLSALQAYALVKHVPIVAADGGKLDRAALLDAIKAGNEPKL